MPRLDQILKMLDKTPGDAFLHYGAGIEYRKQRDFAKAVEHFDRTIAIDPSYCYAYYQKGQTLEESGSIDAAIATYKAGIAAAIDIADTKAQAELTQALSIIE